MAPIADPATQAAAALKMALRAVLLSGQAPKSSCRTPETAKAGPGSPGPARAKSAVLDYPPPNKLHNGVPL